MSFYLVPSVSYQTKQKMDQQKAVKKKRRSRERRSGLSLGGASDAMSLRADAGSIKTEIVPITTGESHTLEEASGHIDEETLPSPHTSNIALGIAEKFSRTQQPREYVSPLHEDKKYARSNLSLLTTSSTRQGSLSSSHSHSKGRFSRKLSTTFLSDKKVLELAPVEADKPPHISPVPRYKPLMDLAALNSFATMKESLFTPTFQIFRYSNYLDILGEHLGSDPINFASVRHHLLLKFIKRHRDSAELRDTVPQLLPQNDDIRQYETWLAYELFQARHFLRELIQIESSKRANRTPIINCEELEQVNIVNYVRFVLDLPLPPPSPISELDQHLAMNYRMRLVFDQIANALVVLKREDDGSGDDSGASVALLLQAITKVSYEFILLEKYHIHILSKWNNNSVLESRVTKSLFDKRVHFLKQLSKESVKVLHYNTYFSAQYSWYAAVTLPFIRFFEANIHAEDPHLVSDKKLYYENMTQQKQTSFLELDEALYEKHFRYVDFRNYDEFKKITPDHLVTLHRGIIKDNPVNKPYNFEYYTQLLATIALGTFDVVQTRDITLQLTHLNYPVIILEFHRILKTGGFLEVPLIKFGFESWDLPSGLGTYPYPDRSDFMKLEFNDQFEIMPKFVETLFGLLSDLFGQKNVRFGILLLNAESEVNSFLLKHLALTLHEMFGELESFCAQFDENDNSLSKSVDQGLHYYFYIRAEKT